MEMNFCRRCGTALTQINGHVYKCVNSHTLFLNASPASAIWLVNNDNEVLVIRRGIEPGIGMLDAPGGFVDGDSENFEQALAREISEEVGLTQDQYDTPSYLFSRIDPYKYGGETVSVMTNFYWARVHDDATITPMDDVESAEFIAFRNIDREKVYFESAKDSLNTLQNLLS